MLYPDDPPQSKDNEEPKASVGVLRVDVNNIKTQRHRHHQAVEHFSLVGEILELVCIYLEEDFHEEEAEEGKREVVEDDGSEGASGVVVQLQQQHSHHQRRVHQHQSHHRHLARCGGEDVLQMFPCVPGYPQS